MDATDKQVDFISDLLGQVNLTEEQQTEAQRQLANGLSKRVASAWIQKLHDLKAQQRRAVTRPTVPAHHRDIPAGHYAITTADGLRTSFYKVDTPTEGRWAGYIFVKLQVSERYERISRQQRDYVLDYIAEVGPESAMRRYGLEIGRCGRCHITLTNNISRKLGIGPVCRRNLGWSD